MSTPEIAEIHSRCEQTTLFQIECIHQQQDSTYQWEPLSAQRRIQGRFLSHNKALDLKHRVLYAYGEFYGDMLVFVNEDAATTAAKTLSKFVDMPLRVMRVQRIRIQAQVGKTILPAGGIG